MRTTFKPAMPPGVEIAAREKVGARVSYVFLSGDAVPVKAAPEDRRFVVVRARRVSSKKG